MSNYPAEKPARRVSSLPDAYTLPADALAVLVDLLANAVAARVAAIVLDAMTASGQATSQAGTRPSPEAWRLLNVAQVAELLGRSPRWVHGAVKDKGLPYIRLDGGALAFDVDDVRAWARARRVPEAGPSMLSGRCQVPANGRRDLTVKQKARAR
jgi:predicted DNA-binding transcriptional regulator AlpA